VSAVAGWWVFVLRYEAREMWRAIPGPWWVKVLLIVITQAIPGPQDELVLLAVVAAFRKRQASRDDRR